MSDAGAFDPASLKVFSYRIPLTRPVIIGGLRKTHAEGFLLRSGAMWGDVAPLAGYSSESLNDVRRCLTDPFSHFPSVQWGMEVLRNDSTLIVADGTVPIARLIQRGQIDETLRATEVAVAAGYRTIKYKVGGRAIADDIAMIRCLAAALPNGVRIRLDANRSWKIDEAVAFGCGVEGLPVEFLEEPLMDVSAYAELEQRTRIPLALDESLAEASELLGRSWTNLAAFVIKPMRLGGRGTLNRLFQQAGDCGIYCVISSMYESGVGIRALLALAAEIAPGIAAGLDTYGMLADDVVTPRLITCDGSMDAKQADPQNWTVHADKLEQIA